MVTKKWRKPGAILAIWIAVFSLSTTVIADDDDDNEKSEYYQKSDDHGDDGEEQQNSNQQSHFTVVQQNEYWNLWSREPRNNLNNPLPITAPSELTVIFGNQETNLYFIPQEGQLLVSGEALAGLIGADVKYYPQSKISILTKGNHELMVRAGSNAVFENGVKTPMPTKAASYEKSVYLPVSVAANALGCRITWDLNKKALVFQEI
jgi:hypothetical protein